MNSQAAELLRSCDLIPLFIEVMGWERHGRPLPVTIVEIGVASPRTLAFCLKGIAQKRGVQVFLCPPDKYGCIPNQTTRRLIQSQVNGTAYHNIVVFTDAAHKVQVWQWAERRAEERSMRVYEYRIGNEKQRMEMLSRLMPITFKFDEEAHLTLVDVVQRLKTAFTDDHTYIERGKHGREGLRGYDLAEMDQGIRYWWERVLREPRLTSEEEYLVACAMRNGNLRARNLLVRTHLHLVARITWKLVGKHQCPPTDYLDLVQSGNLEMMRVAPGFDPNSGVRFQTYITFRVTKTLKRILAGEEGLIPIPRHLLDSMPGLHERRAAVEDILFQRLGRMPYESEVTRQLAVEYQVPPENVVRVLSIQDGFLSWELLVEALDNVEHDQEEDAYKVIPSSSAYGLTISDQQSPSDAAMNLIRREQLDTVLNKLTPRERDVLWLRFGLNNSYAHTLEEVGQRFAVTRERVRQIELRALKKLRRMGPVTVNEKDELVTTPPLKQPQMRQATEDFTDADGAI